MFPFPTLPPPARSLRRRAAAASLVTLLAVCTADYWTGPLLLVDLFYVFPVVLAAWAVGKEFGASLAVVGGSMTPIVQQLHELHRSYALSVWNSLMRIGVLVALVAAVEFVRAALLRQKETIEALEEALARVEQLRGLLPVCAWCHDIRTQSGEWQKIEAYVSAHSEAEFTHGICPACEARLRKQTQEARAR